MLITRKQQAGLTLVELMIGLLVGTIIIAGGLRVFTVVIRGQSDNVKLTRLNQDMRAMMDIMVRDIRRAGFVTSDPENNLSSLKNNPFFDAITPGATTDIRIHNCNDVDNDGYCKCDDVDNDGYCKPLLGDVDEPGDCLVYSYNRNNETPPVVNASPDNERLGFKLDGTKLLILKKGYTTESCDNSSWQSISDDAVEITELQFSLTEKELNVTSMTKDVNPVDGIMDGDDNGDGFCDVSEKCTICVTSESCLIVRNVAITLTGQLSTDPTIKQTITAFVRIRNDKFVEQFVEQFP